MDTCHIEYLETVAEHGSISAAARALDLNQPSLTKILHRLEHEFGVPLFERSARGVKMTTFGERFLARSRLISREMRDLVTELKDLKSGRSGHVTVGTGQIWLSSILPSAIATCARQLPDLTTTIRTGAHEILLAQLHSGELDAFLGAVADDVGVEVQTTPVASVRFDLAAREGHPLTGAELTISAPRSSPNPLRNVRTMVNDETGKRKFVVPHVRRVGDSRLQFAAQTIPRRSRCLCG
jgi:LysR family transcriptional regulator of abg operon